MQNPNNQKPPRRYSILEGNSVEATGTLIQFISITEWPFLQAVLLIDSPQDRTGNIVSYPVNRIKALPTQEEANEVYNEIYNNSSPNSIGSNLTLEEQHRRLIKSYNSTILELSYLKQHNEELRLEIAANKEQFKTLTESNDGLQKQVKDKESKLFNCANEILNLHDRIKLLEMQNYDHVKSIASKDIELNKFKGAVETLTKNNQELFNQREAANEAIVKHQQELKELRINYTRKIENIKRQFRDIAFNE